MSGPQVLRCVVVSDFNLIFRKTKCIMRLYESSSHINGGLCGKVTRYTVETEVISFVIPWSDLKQKAPPERIFPPFDKELSIAWGDGTLVSYHGDTIGQAMLRVRNNKILTACQIILI
jgi:hypothetical protein